MIFQIDLEVKMGSDLIQRSKKKLVLLSDLEVKLGSHLIQGSKEIFNENVK
jgi:hypothetical protein